MRMVKAKEMRAAEDVGCWLWRSGAGTGTGAGRKWNERFAEGQGIAVVVGPHTC